MSRIYPEFTLAKNEFSTLDQYPLVSVIIDNYNYAPYLGKAIDSVLEQTYQHLEVIVVDDGSTDNSRDIIELYGSRIKAIFKSNGGQASAFNAGISAAIGQIVCLLDADDYYHPNKLENVVMGFRKKTSYLQIIDPWILVDKHENIIRCSSSTNFSEGDVRDIIFKVGQYKKAATASSFSFRREALDAVLPIPEYLKRGGADGYLSIAIALLGEVGYVKQASTYYRKHGKNSLSGNADIEYRLEKRIVRAKQINELAERSGIPKRYDLDKDAEYRMLKIVERGNVKSNEIAEVIYLNIKRHFYLHRSVRETFTSLFKTFTLFLFPRQHDSLVKLGTKKYLLSKLKISS